MAGTCMFRVCLTIFSLPSISSLDGKDKMVWQHSASRLQLFFLLKDGFSLLAREKKGREKQHGDSLAVSRAAQMTTGFVLMERHQKRETPSHPADPATPRTTVKVTGLRVGKQSESEGLGRGPYLNCTRPRNTWDAVESQDSSIVSSCKFKRHTQSGWWGQAFCGGQALLPDLRRNTCTLLLAGLVVFCGARADRQHMYIPC